MPAWLTADESVNAPALRTWVRLRPLADESLQTAPLSMPRVLAAAGKCASVVYAHLAILRRAGALDWRRTPDGRVILVFRLEAPSSGMPESVPNRARIESGTPENPPPFEAETAPEPPNSGFPETGTALSLKSSESFNNRLSIRGEREAGFRITGSGEAEPGRAAAAVYRRICGLRPNASQRLWIEREVHDLARWEATLEHWRVHAWNPRNIPGMLDLYRRGGPSACSHCAPKPRRGVSPPEPPQDPIQELKQKYGLE